MSSELASLLIDHPAPADRIPVLTEAPRRVQATVKWFDAVRGFGFLVSDSIDGDILLHFSMLRDHGRRSVPEGALVTCDVVRHNRGFQASLVLEIDLAEAALPSTPPATDPASRADRQSLLNGASSF